MQEPVAAERKDDGKEDQDARRQREKDLMHKRRDLDYARLSVQTSAIERQIRVMTGEQELAAAERAVQKARRELVLHQEEKAPRELEEQRIRLDYQIQRAEEAKEELAELEAMYQADEFAASTKEIVVKRGRRQLEMAERNLAVARAEFQFHQEHEAPEQVRDLTQKLKDAELGLEKARLEHGKMQTELGVQQRQADDRVRDLQVEIEELERKQAEGSK